MPLGAADATRIDHSRRLSPGIWIAAAAEIAVAIAVATLILQANHAMPEMDARPGMADMHPSRSPQSAWYPLVFTAAGVTASMLVWWLVARARIPAVLTAAGLVGLGVSGPVRAMAVQSHLVAMTVLDALLVGVPLLIIATLPRRPATTTGSGQSRVWTGWVIGAVALNSVLLIALHLPAFHRRGAHLDMVPLWLTLLVVLIGLSYWAAIILTAGRVRPALRRGALVIGQEVAAILGLAALLGPDPHMHHTNPLGLPPTVDQRLGGILMLATCAAVTLPLAKYIEQQPFPMEHDVH